MILIFLENSLIIHLDAKMTIIIFIIFIIIIITREVQICTYIYNANHFHPDFCNTNLQHSNKWIHHSFFQNNFCIDKNPRIVLVVRKIKMRTQPIK